MTKVVAYTDGGSEMIEGIWYGGWGMWLKTDDGVEEQRWQGMPAGTTNNRAEMGGYIRLLELALLHKWTYVETYIDSQTVIKGATSHLKTWRVNGWKTRMGEPVKNKDLWVIIDDLQKQCSTKGIVFNIGWVKGHSGVFGNEMADQGATKARGLSYQDTHEEYVVDLGKVTAADVPKVDPKGKKVKIPTSPALLSGSKIIDSVNIQSQENVYYTMSTAASAKDDIPHRFVGVASADRFEGVVILNEPNAVIQAIREAQNEAVPVDYEIPYLINWSSVKSSKNWKVFNTELKDCLRPCPSSGSLDYWDGDTEISYLFTTPRMARFALDTMERKMDLLRRFQDKDAKLECHDVTEMFFDINEKGKHTIKDIMAKQKRIDFFFKMNGQMVPIPMVQDKNMPDRNHLARAAKEGKSIKMTLVIHSKTATLARFAMVVETGQGMGIYNCPSNDLIIIP